MGAADIWIKQDPDSGAGIFREGDVGHPTLGSADFDAKTLLHGILVAKPSVTPHNPGMETPINRPELDAKLATIEAKMEGRLARIDDRLAGIETRLGTTNRNVWAATAVTVGTIIAAVALAVSSFDSGRETASMVNEAEKRIEATVSKAVSDIQAAVKAAVPPPAQ